MGKIWLIIKREFLTRVRKRTFIVLTILGPVLTSLVFVLPAYLATIPDEDKMITVLDEASLMDFDKGKDGIKLRYLPPDKFNRKQALEFSEAQDDYAFMYVPISSGGDPDFLARNVLVYRDGDLALGVENYLEDRLEKYIQNEKLKASGVDPEIMARTKTHVNIRTINTQEGTETENAAIVKMGVGYVVSFLIYIFIFMYGAQVMRGVIEEKSSRIMEIMVSAVKPFQLMSGKIIGVALVALLQFFIWLVFAGVIYFVVMHFILGEAISPENMVQNELLMSNSDKMVFSLVSTLSTINFPLIIGSFIFYFIFGYLLYAAMFAAVGSAVDKESDSSQFIWPVTIPLVIAIVVLFKALDSPDSAVAFWFSIIPFTSPIIMMARIPFGVPVWELVLSMGVLVLAFWLITGLAAKIYRIGILMYGKKPSLTELWRWMRTSGN